MRRLLFVAVLGILILMLLNACGGYSSISYGAKSGEHSGGGGTGVTAQKTVVVKESEFELDPSNVTLDKPGTHIFEAKNIGTTAHTLKMKATVWRLRRTGWMQEAVGRSRLS